jgi:hypothetical protein
MYLSFFQSRINRRKSIHGDRGAPVEFPRLGLPSSQPILVVWILYWRFRKPFDHRQNSPIADPACTESFLTDGLCRSIHLIKSTLISAGCGPFERHPVCFVSIDMRRSASKIVPTTSTMTIWPTWARICHNAQRPLTSVLLLNPYSADRFAPGAFRP